MAPERTPDRPGSDAEARRPELERALVELREANERLVAVGVRMQELADEAQASNRAKDEFLAALSHELRTPLNAILGWTHMLRRTSMSDAAVEHAYEIIERNAKLQAQLISDLLQVSEIITGRLRLNFEPVDLATCVEAGVDALRPTASAKEIRLESHIDPRVRRVRADPSRVQQILWNVLSNALKFTPRGGEVHVSLAQVRSTAEISVADSGVGIEPDFLPFVFDRFRQGDSTSRRAFGGLGLGLAIVKQLTELHGGTVRCESAGLGRGATFRVAFPIPALALPPDRVQRDCSSSSLQGMRLLIVEDEPDSRELMTALLSGNGALVTAVASAREAVAEWDTDVPDLMITDIGLPDEDGYDLLREVRSRESHGRNVPVVALTAYAGPEDRATVLAAGFYVHMTKPVDPEEFVQSIAVLVRSFRGRAGEQ